MSPRAVWGGLFAVGTAYEVHALVTNREGHTLSEVTREVFRVHSPAGKVAFVASWFTLTGWLVPHIAFKAVEKAAAAAADVAGDLADLTSR